MYTTMPCLIWRTPAIEIPLNADGRTIDSPRAGGKYFVAGSAEGLVESCDDRKNIRITNWLIEQRRLGNQCPSIYTTTVHDAEHWKDMSIMNRAGSILKYLESNTKILGSRIGFRMLLLEKYTRQIDNLDKAYLEFLAHSGCISRHDLYFMLEYLERRRLIEISGRNNPEMACTLSIEGYAYLAELKEAHAASSKAFIAMWFDDTMNDAWERGIAPAVRDAGYDPVRIDRKEHVNKIDDEIIAEMRRARFVIADFTQGAAGARGGVYYEAGFAHGLDIPVIFTCRKDSLDKVHFDTRQYNHIVWTEPEELRQSLKNRIAAVIGDGPDKPPG